MPRITWPIGRGSKTTTYLESPTPICLLTMTLYGAPMKNRGCLLMRPLILKAKSSENFEWSQRHYIVLCRLSTDPKMRDPEWPFCVKFCFIRRHVGMSGFRSLATVRLVVNIGEHQTEMKGIARFSCDSTASLFISLHFCMTTVGAACDVLSGQCAIAAALL